MWLIKKQQKIRANKILTNNFCMAPKEIVIEGILGSLTRHVIGQTHRGKEGVIVPIRLSPVIRKTLKSHSMHLDMATDILL